MRRGEISKYHLRSFTWLPSSALAYLFRSQYRTTLGVIAVLICLLEIDRSAVLKFLRIHVSLEWLWVYNMSYRSFHSHTFFVQNLIKQCFNLRQRRPKDRFSSQEFYQNSCVIELAICDMIIDVVF